MKRVECECGVVLEASTDDEIVALVQEHGRSVHRIEVSREQALALAVEVGGDG